ncbi:MAG: hypothetical protein R2687_01535 [Candidatus Nanopelagicales bacterium]
MTATDAPDAYLTAALADHGDPLTGDQYVEYVLLARQTAWADQHRAASEAKGLKLSRITTPLLPDFVLEADIAHVQLPQTTPKPRPQPRRYRPASYWRDRVNKLSTEMQRLAEPIITDRAAAGGTGLGPKRTRRAQQQMDTRLARYTQLQRRRAYAQQMLQAAQAREACHTEG